MMAMKRPGTPAPSSPGRAAVGPAAAAPLSVSRWSTAATVTTACAAVAVAAAALAPYLVGTNVTQPMVTLFLLAAMASLWNLLAGYAGMISFGQQAYLGIGAYALYLLGRAGISPFAAIGLAALAAAVSSAGIFLILRRLSGGYFAVASWVVAECLFLYATTQAWLGGGTGVGLQQLSSMVPVVREADTYWTALAVLVLCAGGGYLLVRSRFGLDSRATGGDPVAAAAVGVEVQRTRRLAYVLAAAGFGAIGAMLLISGLYIDPASVFSINYSADMLFMVVIGGLGTIEGPLIGALVLFAAQQVLAQYGAWYLVGIGALAIAVVLLAPAGLWGSVSGRQGWSLLPVGYRVRSPRRTP